MDDSKEISDFLKACNDKDYLQKDINSFLIAIDFAKKNLENRKRESGEYIYQNNINIGIILVKSNLSKEIVIAGLLYGLEKLVIAKEIKETFGEDIASIIFGQLQFNEVKKGNKNLEAGIIRKILLTSLYDVRIILVKLAVKLASLNTIQVFDAKKQKEIAKEVLEIYVPLAARLGLEYIRTRLESLAFKVVYPKQYLEISNFFKETSKEREEFVSSIDHEKFSTNASENYYEILKELASALLLLDGLKTTGEYAHKDLIDYLINYEEFKESEILFMNDLRIKRNNCAYDGKKIDPSYLINNKCQILELIEKLKKTIKNGL